MPHPLELVSKAVQEQLPKALVGLMVPAGQLAWKTWRDRQASSRVAALRAHITDLGRFLQTPLGDSPSAIAIRQSTQVEYEKALHDLAELSRPAQSKAAEKPQSGSRSLIRRAFLLYTPRSIKGWVAHSLYYVFLAVTVLGTLGLILSGEASNDLAGTSAAMGFYAVVTFFLWLWAHRIAGSERAEPNKPGGRRAWIPTTLIWISALVGYSILVGLSLDQNDEFSGAVLRSNLGPLLAVIAVSAVVIVLCVRWRRRINKDRPPGLRFGWVPIALIVISAVFEVSAVAGELAAVEEDPGSFRLAMLWNNGAFLAVNAVCISVIVLSVLWRRRMKKKLRATTNVPSSPATASDEESKARTQAAS